MRIYRLLRVAELLTVQLTKSVFKKEVTLAMITHAHEDRIGGIDTLLEKGIDVWSTSLTVQQAEKNGFSKPRPKLDADPGITISNVDFEIFYPGEGHSIDNITIWLPQYKVLFGGCIIKSLESKNLGSTADANIQEWPSSMKKILEKYSDAEVVIPIVLCKKLSYFRTMKAYFLNNFEV